MREEIGERYHGELYTDPIWSKVITSGGEFLGSELKSTSDFIMGKCPNARAMPVNLDKWGKERCCILPQYNFNAIDAGDIEWRCVVQCRELCPCEEALIWGPSHDLLLQPPESAPSLPIQRRHVDIEDSEK